MIDDGRLTPDDILGCLEDFLLDENVAFYVRVNAGKTLLQWHRDSAKTEDVSESARDFVDGLLTEDEGNDNG